MATFCLAICTTQLGCDLKSDGTGPTPTTHGELHENGDPSATTPAGEKTVSVKVNTMTCVAGCFNGIQTVLKKRPGIKDVKLAPQSNDEGQVDNSVILVSYQGELDRAEVERTIVGAGFESIEFLDADAPLN